MGMREITWDAIFDFFSRRNAHDLPLQNGLLLDVQHVTMRFGGGITAVNDLSMRIPTGPSPGSSAPTA